MPAKKARAKKAKAPVHEAPVLKEEPAPVEEKPVITEPVSEPVVVDHSIVTKPHMKIVQMTVLMPVAIVIIVLVGVSAYYFKQYKTTEQVLSNATSTTPSEVQQVVSKVEQLIEVPTDEMPTLATVTDIQKLKGQPFFVDAMNGDKVLIFTKAKKAYLYRPSINKIINVGPIDITNASPTPAASASASISPTSAPATLAFYNGAGTSGLAKAAEELVKTHQMDNTVVALTNADKSNYAHTLVVDLSGNQQQTATALAALLHGQVASLPQGEVAPKGVDILIIVGKDFEKK